MAIRVSRLLGRSVVEATRQSEVLSRAQSAATKAISNPSIQHATVNSGIMKNIPTRDTNRRITPIILFGVKGVNRCLTMRRGLSFS